MDELGNIYVARYEFQVNLLVFSWKFVKINFINKK
jgi:hypothetical protein